MIGILKELERRASAKLFTRAFQKLQFRKFIAGALQEEHQDLHIKQVLRAVDRWFAGWMERKSQENQAADSGQRRLRLRLGSHSSAKRFAAGEKRQLRNQPRCFEYGGANGSVRYFRRVWSF